MLHKNIIYAPGVDFEFKLKKAKGSHIWTDKNEKLIDFTSGWNVCNLGWNNEKIIDAVVRQSKKNLYAPLWGSDDIQQEYADAFSKSLPKELSALSKATGGTEANEQAIKTARVFTKRKKILGFSDAYHGESTALLELTSQRTDEFLQMNFPKKAENNSKSSENKILLDNFKNELDRILSKRDVAGLICEAAMITGSGSLPIAPDGFLKIARDITKKYGTLLILDEVGTGFSRCCELYGMNLEKVVPDIATFAKGISNGAAAIGTMATTQEIAQKTYNETVLISTFGWTSIACAASLETLNIHQKQRTWQKSKKNGEYIIKVLRDELKNNSEIRNIDGKGMEIGVRLHPMKVSYSKIKELAHKKGLHLTGDGLSNIQLMPPITIEREVLDEGLGILIKVIKDYRRKKLND